MLIEHRDFTLDLPDGWHRDDRDDACELVRDDGSQIIVSCFQVKAGAPLKGVLARVIELRQQAQLDLDPSAVFEGVVHTDYPDRYVSSYAGRAPAHKVSFFAAGVIATRALMDTHLMVTFAFTGGDNAATEGRELFERLQFQPHAAAIEHAQDQMGQPVRTERLYPYVVPASYLESMPTHQPLRTLGHDLVLMIAEDLDGTCRVLAREQLREEGLAVDTVLDQACVNLETLLKRQEITMQSFRVERGTIVRFGDHWLAASCLVHTGVADFVRKTLATDEDIYVSVPHRDVMLCFPASLQKVACKLIREHESDGRKPLTWELFRWTERGAEPVPNVRN